MKMKVRPLLVFCMVLSILAGSLLINPSNLVKADSAQWGFHIESDGTVTLGGKPFYGIGMNMWDGFNRTINNPLYQEYAPSLKVLADNKIPFIRVSFSGYYANDIKEYRDDPTTYFANLDKFVKTAENYHIGIIASLFWAYYSVPDLVGEKVSKLGNPNSQSSAFVRQFVTDVVTRYKDSPAIWAWEVGNENNNVCDIGYAPPVVVNEGTPSTRSTDDFLSSTQMNVYINTVANQIRKYDTYRMISNGDAEYRNAQYNLRVNGTWQQDTYDELKTVIGVFTPNTVDAISVHIYDIDQPRFGRTAGIEEMLQNYVSIAKSYHKTLYFGEFGAKSDDIMVREINAIKASGIQLSSPWNFDEEGMGHDSFSNVGNGSYCFTRSVELNQYYRSQGLQDTDLIWSKTTPATSNPTSPTAPSDNSNATTKTPTGRQPAGTTGTSSQGGDDTISGTSSVDSDGSAISSETASGISLNAGSADTNKMAVDNQNKLLYIVPDLKYREFADIFQLDSSYTYQVYSDAGEEITADDAILQEGYQLKVYKAGNEISVYTFKIGSHTVTEGASYTWLVILIVILAVAAGSVTTVLILTKKGIIKIGFLKRMKK
jgi:hypothetical protein